MYKRNYQNIYCNIILKEKCLNNYKNTMSC